MKKRCTAMVILAAVALSACSSADTSFAHIAVNTNPERSGVEWFDILSEEEYAQLPAEKPEENDTQIPTEQ